MSVESEAPPAFLNGFSKETDSGRIIKDIDAQFRRIDPALLMIFASPDRDPAALIAGLSERFPRAEVCGCSTAGEIGPDGFSSGTTSVFGVSSTSRAVAAFIPDLASFTYEQTVTLLGRLARRLRLDLQRPDPRKHLFLLLCDGLCGREELLMASLWLSAPNIPVIGGSAGDDFRFSRTLVGLGDRTGPGAAVVVLLDCAFDYLPFKVDHYDITGEQVLVNSAEPDLRLIHELDGLPAAQRYAELLGVHPGSLQGRPASELKEGNVHFGIRLGMQYFIRSILTVRGHSLLMGGGVEEGTLLTVMRAGRIVERTEKGLSQAISSIYAQPHGLLLFNCGGRLLEARSLGLEDELGRACTPLPSSGFTTYGEQFGSLQVNHSLTGLVLGFGAR